MRSDDARFSPNVDDLYLPSMAKMPDTPKVDLQLQRRLLPIYTARDVLIREIKSNVSCVVVGETGSGKTTQIPQVWRVDRDVGGTIDIDDIYGGTEVSFSYMSFGHIVSA